MVCVEQARLSAWFKTLQCPDTSLCRRLPLINKMNWFQSCPRSFGGFSTRLYLKLHVQGKYVLVPALLNMSCVLTYRRTSCYDITGGDITRPGGVGFGNHDGGMSMTQRAGLLWLANGFGPDIWGKNKPSAISNNAQSTLTFSGRQIAHEEITTCCHANYYTIPWTIIVFRRTINPQQKRMPTINLDLQWVKTSRKK